MGGGLDIALKDFDKALSLDPKLSEAYLWKGVTLRKANRNAEARQAFQKALELIRKECGPSSNWTKRRPPDVAPRAAVACHLRSRLA